MHEGVNVHSAACFVQNRCAQKSYRLCALGDMIYCRRALFALREIQSADTVHSSVCSIWLARMPHR